MGKPEYLSAEIVAELDSVSELRRDPLVFRSESGTCSIDVTMPPQSVASIDLRY